MRSARSDTDPGCSGLLQKDKRQHAKRYAGTYDKSDIQIGRSCQLDRLSNNVPRSTDAHRDGNQLQRAIRFPAAADCKQSEIPHFWLRHASRSTTSNRRLWSRCSRGPRCREGYVLSSRLVSGTAFFESFETLNRVEAATDTAGRAACKLDSCQAISPAHLQE